MSKKLSSILNGMAVRKAISPLITLTAFTLYPLPVELTCCLPVDA
jgi:hypothetical protein